MLTDHGSCGPQVSVWDVAVRKGQEEVNGCLACKLHPLRLFRHGDYLFAKDQSKRSCSSPSAKSQRANLGSLICTR